MAEGDDERWRRVFEAEQGRMYRALLAHTADAEVAADAVAEAFAQGLRRGAGVMDPAAWVWRTAFRVAAGQMADRRRGGGALPVDHPDPAGVPDDVVALVDALARLPEADRQVVVLCLVGGLGAAEVGAVVGASAGAVRVRLHRARRRLQLALADPPLPDPEEVP